MKQSLYIIFPRGYFRKAFQRIAKNTGINYCFFPGLNSVNINAKYLSGIISVTYLKPWFAIIFVRYH